MKHSTTERHRLRASATDRGWEMIEPGWWFKPNVGGVVREGEAKWSAHPWVIPIQSDAPVFRTMTQAMEHLELVAKQEDKP